MFGTPSKVKFVLRGEFVRKVAVNIFLVFMIFIVGCSSVKQVTKSSQNQSASQPDMIAKDPNYRIAMDHFVDGTLNDVKGEYARAILDYQDALRHYRDGSILDAMAQDYIKLGKPDIAIEESKEAISLAPRNINYRRTRAQAYLSVFNIDSARSEYEKILSIDSTQVEDLLILAQLYQHDNPQRAAELYRKALSLEGPNLPTMMQLVQIYNSTNQFEKSIGVVKEMLKMDPSNVALKEMLSDLYLQTGNNEGALKIIDDLMLARKNDFNLKARAATAYLRMRNFAKADSLLDTIFTSDSSRADAKFAIAQFYLNEMQRDTSVIPFAQQIFKKLLILYPNDARAYFMAGLGASYAQQDSLAEEYLNKSIAIDSTNQDAWQALAVLYYQKNHFNRMAEVMSRAVKILPDNFRVNLFLGLALNRAGKNEDAAAPLQKAVALKPTDMDALSTLALVYEALHKYDDADRIYDTALKVDPKNALILNNYAYSLAERGIDVTRALKMAELAIQLDPKNSAYLDTIGWVYFKLGDYENAASYVKKALSLRGPADGSPATLEEHLGDIYEKMGQKSKALEYWQKALDHDPSNSSLKDKIEKAKG